MGGLWQRASGLAGRLTDLLLPPLCLSCRMPVLTPASLCMECWQQLTLIDTPCCDVLGLPFPYASSPGLVSPQALRDPPPFRKARAAVLYDDLAATIVHGGKYGDRQENLHLMSRLMARAGRELLAEADLIVPVPLHWRRLFHRRYNQSAILALDLARQEGMPVFAPEVLGRIRPTAAQASLDDVKARSRNVRRAFAVPEIRLDQIRNRRILLVDAVMTTGATVGACTKALLKAGAARVDVLVFALVLDQGRIHI